jgi:predicted amidohydrolase YtcJ
MEGGEIVADPVTHEPTGVFIDDAIEYVTKHIPVPGLDVLLKYVDVATGEMVKAGLTGLHDAGVSLEELELFKV